MSTHSLRKKLLRYRPQSTKRQRLMRSVRQYAPWVAAICVGAYLPPKVLSSTWLVDRDDVWSNTANWSGGVIPGSPTNPGGFADFTFGFTANRTVSLAGPPSIEPVLSQVRFDDTTPASVLTIAADVFDIKLRGASVPFTVTKGNTLAITGLTTAASVLRDETGAGGLNKLGAGLLDIRASAGYTGATTLTQGVLVASTIANGLSNSSIGASDNSAANLIFNGGILRYVAPAAVTVLQMTDRGFQIQAGGSASGIPNLNSNATIDSSSANAAAALSFSLPTTNSTAIVPGSANSVTGGTPLSGGPLITSNTPGNRLLILRGINTGNNEIGATIPDFGNGNKTTLRKLDIGLWRLSALVQANGQTYTPVSLANYVGNTYSGDTIIERGTLQLVFPALPTNSVSSGTPPAYIYPPGTAVHVINPLSTLQLGSTSNNPGGGTLDTTGGQVQRTIASSPGGIVASYQGTYQQFANLIVNAGANQITRTGSFVSVETMPFIYFDNFNGAVHMPGATLRLSTDYAVRTSNASRATLGGIVNGWTHRDDTWVSTLAVPVDRAVGYSAVQIQGLVAATTSPLSVLRTADDSNNLPEAFNPTDNMVVNSPLNGRVFSVGSSNPGNQFFINSLLFTGSPAAPLPNKRLIVSDGADGAGFPDDGYGPAVLTLLTGGMLNTSSSGITQLYGGGLTSGSGDFFTDFSDINNPKIVGTGGGTVGHSEIFLIQRSAQPLYISSAIQDYIGRFDSSMRITVGLTKSGTGSVVLFDATSSGSAGATLSTFQGDVYINEGAIVVRADQALGATVDDDTTYHSATETSGNLGQTYMLGPTSVLDFQGVNYTAAEKVNYYLGEIRASIGRSSFGGSINNLNEEVKAIINVGASNGSANILTLNGDLTGVGGYQKIGTGLLVVNGNTTVSTISDIIDSGNIELNAGLSSWNGNISITNGSLTLISGQHAINGNLTIVNGHIINTNSFLALTKPGATYDVDLQQSGASAVTQFGTINQTAADLPQTITGLISLNNVAGVNAGSITINGSVNFATLGAPLPFNLSSGFLTQLATVNSQLIPTTNIFGAAMFAQSATTITLNHNTTFNSTVTLGAAAAATNLVANGIGVTSFKDAVTLLNSADVMTLTNAAFTKAHTLSTGTLNLNGLNVFNPTSGSGSTTALTVTGGTLNESGTRRSAGVYGVRNTINGDLAVTNGPAAAATLAPTFSGNNAITGNILITGTAPLTGVTNGTGVTNSIVTATLANAQKFTGALTLNGGQVTIASSNALGSGVGAAGGGAGVSMVGEKSSLFFQRGVQTAVNEDITIGPTTAYVSGVAVINFGTAYASAPLLSFSGGGSGGFINAAATTNLSGTSVGSVTVSNVGATYSSAPTITPNSGAATFAAVFGGPIIRGVDQHNVIDANIILNNTNTSSATGTVGAVSLATPLLSVGQDDSLQITKDIYGISGNVTAGTAGRRITTAILGGGANNSSSGTIILSGQVKDTSSGFATPGSLNVLNFEIAGNNDLNVQMEKQYRANGLLQLSQGVLRNTNTADSNFFATGVTGNFALSVNGDTTVTATNTAAVIAQNRSSVGFNSTLGNAVNIQSAAYFLTNAGQVFNASLTAYLGNSNRVAADGTNTGFVVIGGENTTGTVTYGLGSLTTTTTSSITLSSDNTTALRDLRLFANLGGTVEIKSNFLKVGNGFVSIDKVGDGTVILSGNGGVATGASALDRTYVLGGTLELGGFANNPTVPRLSTSPSASLVLGGGRLRLNTTGTTATSINQSIQGNATLRNGLSSIEIQNTLNAGQTVNLNIGTGSSNTLTRLVGGVLRFASTGVGTSNINFNTSITRAQPIGFTAFGTATDPASTLRATNFGIFDASTGKVSAYTAATNQDGLATTSTQNIQEGGTGFFQALPGTITTLNTVRFTGSATAGHGVLDLGSQAIAVTGGIMLASDTVGDRSIINGASLSASGANDLVIQNWGGTASKLTIGSLIVNTATAGALTPLTLAGDGVTLLTNNANNFKGDVFLSGGTLRVSSAAPLGADTGLPAVAIKSLQLDGGTLNTTSNFNWTSRNIVVYGDRSTIAVAPGTTFTLTGGAVVPAQTAPTLAFTGGINSESPEVGNNITYASFTGYGSGTTTAASGAANIFNGDLIISGGGTFIQQRDGTANTIAGQMFVSGGSRFVYEGNNNGFLGNNLSWMDGTTVSGNSTIEVRPTINSSGTNTIGEYLHFGGPGQTGSGGAIVMKLPQAAVNAAATLTDHTLSWTGPMIMDSDASIFVDDTAETFAAGLVGMLSIDDSLFDGTGKALTKNGPGILRFINSRIQNLATINVLAGEVRFEGGNLGTIGSEVNKTQSGGTVITAASATGLYNNYTTGTNSIVVGDTTAATFAAAPRLSFVDARGAHNANIDLKGAYMFVQSADAPLQATSFAGDITLTGVAAANGLEAIYVNRVNPVVMFGALKGTGGLTKFGNNEIDFVNPNNSFSGELLIARGGGSVTSPGVGLYDGGRFTAATSIRLTNDGTLFLDNRNGLDADTSNDLQLNRINDAAAIHMGGAARIRLLGNNPLGNNTAASTETVGALNLHRGSSVIELDPGVNGQGALQNIGMTFASFQRDAGSVVNFRVLKAGVDFGTGTGAGAANITVGTLPASLVGGARTIDGNTSGSVDGNTTGGDGSVSPQNLKILPGAFGGVVARNFSTLPTNTSLGLALNNNDQTFAGRGLLTVETVSGVNYVRPLRDAEYLNATMPDYQSDIYGNPIVDGFGNPVPTQKTRVTSTYDFGPYYTLGVPDPLDINNIVVPGNGTQKNVRLRGGFGPSTTSFAETLFATENFFIFNQGDNSRKQDSLYRVLDNIGFNSLTFAPQTNEIVDQGGNRIILEIQYDKTLTIGSGVILNAGLGIIGAADPNTAHSAVQQALIRGGKVEFGSQEIIIQNVATSLNETTGTFSNARLAGTNVAIGNNNLSLSDLTISSAMHGTNGLTKSGPSGVNLSGLNTYTGDTNVTEGILRLENDQALGLSQMVYISGTGDLRLQRGISVGDVNNPHALKIRFSSIAQPSQLRAEAGNNALYADVQISALNTAGERLVTAAGNPDVSIVNGTGSAFTIGGDIYGLDASTGNITPLNDVQRGRQARIVNFQNASSTGGTIEIRGSFRDLASGAVPSFVTSANEEQVLRAAFTGSNNSNINVYSSWDAAGSILLRQGALHVMPGVTNFFTSAAANAINPSNAQARPTIGDVAGGEASLTLTTAGQTFNSPTLLVSNASSGNNVTIGGENTSGTVKFFAPSTATEYNNATLRVSAWDRNVRLYAAPGGSVEVYGRIIDTAGNGSITKIGGGTVTMKGMDGNTAGYTIGTSNNNDFDKQIASAAGTLILDYNVSSSTNPTIDTTAFNLWGTTGTQVTLAGGKLQLLGDSTATAVQTWNAGLITKAGASELSIVPTGTGTVTLNFNGTLTRAVGSTVNFTTPGSAGKINLQITAGLGASGAVIAPWVTFGAAPGVVTDFAVTTNDANRTVGALAPAGYTTQSNPQLFASGQIGTEASSGFTSQKLTPGVKMLRFGAPSNATTVNVDPGFTLGNGNATAAFDEGTILVPSGVNALKTIAGGDLQVNSGKELFLLNYGSGGLKMDTTPVIGNSAITISGPGTTTMGLNRQFGVITVNGGVLEIGKLNIDGAAAAPVSFPIGATTVNQTTFTVSDVSGIRTGSPVTGTNIPGGTVVNSINSSTNQITVSGTGATTVNPAVTITITPTTGVMAAFTTTAFTTSPANSVTVPANQTGLAVGQAIAGTGIAPGTVITSIVGTTVNLSQAPTAVGAVAVAVANGLGLAPTNSGLILNGGTLRYTGPSVLTDKIFNIGDNGGTFDIPSAATTVQINGLNAQGIAFSGGGTNTYAGGVIKTGLGTMIFTGPNSTHTGVTDIRAGTLQLTNGASTPPTGSGVLGSETNVLDGTIVRGGATVRFQAISSDVATREWFTYEAGANLELNMPTTARTVSFDGVINFLGAANVRYTGAVAGNSTAAFNSGAGYLIGSGGIVKGTVNNGLGGVLSLNESSPEWTGSLAIEGGRVLIRSLGNPTGTGTAPILLGTAGVNDLNTPTSPGAADARLIFSMRDLFSANGATTLTGAFDSFQINANIPQDILVQRPSSAGAGAISSQTKQIGVIGTGLSVDQYNLNGKLRLQDDLQFYVEDNFANVNAGEEYVNFNVNGPIISEGSYNSTFTSRVNITGRPSGAFSGVYNNLYAVISLNAANPLFTGNLTIGNIAALDADGFAISNPDANHVLRLNHNQSLNQNNKITLLNDATLQAVGHQVTIGSLVDNNIESAQTIFKGGTTTGYISSGARAIVENAAAASARLTINQTEDSEWRFLIRDGVTAEGAVAGPLSLVKQGPATVRILNANYYTGGTTVTDGIVLVRNASFGSATGPGPVAVIGATFGGDNGEFGGVGGPVTFSSSAGARPAVLAPGRITSNGITLGDSLYFDDTITFNRTGFGYTSAQFDTFSDEFIAQNDRVFAKKLIVNSPVDLVLRINGDSDFGHTFTEGDPALLNGEYIRLFVYTLPIQFGPEGSFQYQGQTLHNGSLITGFYRDEAGQPTTNDFVFNFQMSNNDIRLIAVPEPNVALTLASGLGMLLGLQRFRRGRRQG